MTPEDQFILLLGRGTMSHLVREQAFALLGTPLNWEVILQHAINEEIYPLLHRNSERLVEQGPMSWEQEGKGKEQRAESNEQGAESRNQTSEICGHQSETVGYRSAQERLGKLAKINSFRNALLIEELTRVLRLLSEAGLPTIPLKGMALAESVYGDMTARVCSDIDILVPRCDVREAFRILFTAGFEAHDQKVESSEIEGLLDSNIEYSFVRRSEGMTFLLELHWDIAWRWGKNTVVVQDLWDDAQPRQYWETKGYGLSPEWELLYLCAHVARHQWQGLKWLVDIHEMCASPKIDWGKLKLKAKQLGLEPTLMLTLSACHKLFSTSIPKDLRISSLPKWMKIFPESQTSSDIWRSNFFPARLFKRPSDKLRYLARIAFIPTLAEQRLCPLPQSLRFMHHLLRPLRLACMFAAGLFHSAVSVGQPPNVQTTPNDVLTAK